MQSTGLFLRNSDSGGLGWDHVHPQVDGAGGPLVDLGKCWLSRCFSNSLETKSLRRLEDSSFHPLWILIYQQEYQVIFNREVWKTKVYRMP